MAYLWHKHRDQQHGGFFWSVDDTGTSDDVKLAYGHVFVLLAASSAKLAGHPDADRLLTEVAEILDQHYWDKKVDLYRDEFRRDWQPFSTYRGMNANMHGVEAMLTAFEATGETFWLDRAGRVLDFFTKQIAPANGWRLPEHYDEDWQVDPDYSGNPMFRPAGCTPGHSFELGRLLLQHFDLSGRHDATAQTRARWLVTQAFEDAWLPNGGFAYTLRPDGSIDIADRYWWPVTEAIGVMATLQKLDETEETELLYRRIWTFAKAKLIDHVNGGWFPELDVHDQPVPQQFFGKPDIYHSVQAALFPLVSGVSRHYDGLTLLTK
jgi:mannose/cellobiose epimerase-like protein (N-acyl-D-glucosamine 2-epimerase family)